MTAARDRGQEGRRGVGVPAPFPAGVGAARGERTEAHDPGRGDDDDRTRSPVRATGATARRLDARFRDGPWAAMTGVGWRSWRGTARRTGDPPTRAAPRSSPQFGQNRMSPMRSVPQRGQKRGPGAAMAPPGLAAAAPVSELAALVYVPLRVSPPLPRKPGSRAASPYQSSASRILREPPCHDSLFARAERFWRKVEAILSRPAAARCAASPRAGRARFSSRCEAYSGERVNRARGVGWPAWPGVSRTPSDVLPAGRPSDDAAPRWPRTGGRAPSGPGRGTTRRPTGCR